MMILLPGVLILGLVFCNINISTHLLRGHLQFQKLSLPAEHMPGCMDLHEPNTVDFGLQREKGLLVRAFGSWDPFSPWYPAVTDEVWLPLPSTSPFLTIPTFLFFPLFLFFF